MGADYGPNSADVAALVERCRLLTSFELDRIATTLDASAPRWAPWRKSRARKAKDAWRAAASEAFTAAEKAAQQTGRAAECEAAEQAAQAAAWDAVRRALGPRLRAPLWTLAWSARTQLAYGTKDAWSR